MTIVKIPSFNGITPIGKNGAIRVPPVSGKLKSLATNLKQVGSDLKKSIASKKVTTIEPTKNPQAAKQSASNGATSGGTSESKKADNPEKNSTMGLEA